MSYTPGRWDCQYCPEVFDTGLERRSHEGIHKRGVLRKERDPMAKLTVAKILERYPAPWSYEIAPDCSALPGWWVVKDGVLLARTSHEPTAKLLALVPVMVEALQRSHRWLGKGLAEGLEQGTAAPNDLAAVLGLVESLLAETSA